MANSSTSRRSSTIFPEYIETVRSYYPQPPGRNTAVTRAIATARSASFPTSSTTPTTNFPAASAGGGFRSILAVPLMRDGKPVGGLAVGRPEPGQFPESQVALLKTLPTRPSSPSKTCAVHELEARNRDLSEALEQQTATSDILRVISRSQTDVQPVFDTIAAAALTLCRATSALVTRLEGDTVALVASANLTDEGAAAMAEAFPMPVGRGSTSARAILEGRIVVIPDVTKDLDYEVQAQALRAAFRSTLAVPLVREGRPIGTITVGKPEQAPSPIPWWRSCKPSPTRPSSRSRTCACSRSSSRATRPHRVARAADRDQRHPARHQPLADGRATRVRHDRATRSQLCAAHFANVFTLRRPRVALAASCERRSGSARCGALPATRATRRPYACHLRRAVCIPTSADPEYVSTHGARRRRFRSVSAFPYA
jgi:GAF domain-containing protein